MRQDVIHIGGRPGKRASFLIAAAVLVVDLENLRVLQPAPLATATQRHENRSAETVIQVPPADTFLTKKILL
jgi:hypothetical protein